MSIVTISRGSYSRGKEVAEKLARALNYECISREIILEASEHFNIPELKLVGRSTTPRPFWIGSPPARNASWRSSVRRC